LTVRLLEKISAEVRRILSREGKSILSNKENTGGGGGIYCGNAANCRVMTDDRFPSIRKDGIGSGGQALRLWRKRLIDH